MLTGIHVNRVFLLLIVIASVFAQASQCRSSVSEPFVADQTPPTVRFIGLHYYSRIYNQAPLSVGASDDVGVSRIELYIDQALFATNSVSPNLTNVLVNFNLGTAPPGKHWLQAKAYDAAGNVQTTTLIVLSNNLTLPTGNNIAVIPSIRHQIMRGWEATDQAAQLYSAAWNNYRNPLLDLAVNDLGINRIRLEIKSGVENPTDYFTQWRNGQITETQYNAKQYEIINDNADPNSINASGFKWAQLDSSINSIVIPMRQRLQARGESLWVNLNYVDFGSSTFEHKTSPAEYAEFVLATYQHMQNTFGFVPDSWEVILEPDTTTASWSSAQVAQALKAAGDKLAANGFTPNFTAPSTTNAANAPTFIDQIAQTAGALAYVGEFSYHRYCCASDTVLQNIANRGVLYGKRTSMLEWIGADHATLHQDVKMGRTSSWQQFCLAGPTSWGPDSGDRYYIVDDSNTAAPVITMGSRTKFLRQYFKFVRAGAQRVEALTGSTNFDPLAFINTNGKYVVVVQALTGGTFNVSGLPAGAYGIKYTTASQYNIDSTDVTLTPGQPLTTSIPAAGVITIYAR